MERIWAPWRMEYILSKPAEGCIFCPATGADTNRDRLLLATSEYSLVMLNRYPYTNGHLLVAPRAHKADLSLLSSPEILDLMSTVTRTQQIVQNISQPDGFNIGINLGKAAGAGIDDHLHIHIVPRWIGDTNYMTVIPDIRIMPEALLDTYDRLFPLFREAFPEQS